MKFIFNILVVILFIGIGCTPKQTSIKGLAGLLATKDCKGSCAKIMACEGKEKTIEMQLVGDNILISGNTLFVRDPNNYEYTLRIDFGENIPQDSYADAKNLKYKRMIVTGTIEGYDMYVHEKCVRSYIVKVVKQENFKLMEN